MTPDPFKTLWQMGYRDLCPIIPPGAPISDQSALAKRIQKGDDARGKAPGVRWPDGSWSGFDWLPYHADEDDLSRWQAMGAGVGIKCGAVVAIDADTLNEQHAATIRQVVEKHLGLLPTRIGRSPKALYLCKVSAPIRYTRIDFAGDTKPARVEILSTGRQFVAHGVHPETKQPYRWTRKLPPFDELPEFAPLQILDVLQELRTLLPEASQVLQEGSAASVEQETLRGDPTLVRKAVEATPNTSQLFPTRESYRNFGYAVKAALPDHPQEAFNLFADWCARWTGGVNEPETVESDWRRMKPPFRRGAKWLFEIAEQTSGGQFSRAEQWFEPIPEEPESIFGGDENADGPPPVIDATPLEPFDWRKLPPRDSLYGGHYVRQFMSVTVAPSKVGKSSLALVEAVAMATGKPLLGVQPKGCLRVWYWNGEDPQEELLRRVAAILVHYNLTWEDLGGRLFLDSGRKTPIIIAEQTRSGASIAKPVVAQVEDAIRRHRIDVLILDPFVSSHRVSENDNNAIDAVAKQWAAVGDRCNCAIELIHHVRKLNGGETTVEDGRGASALLAASRSARALARMTSTEAAKLGLSDLARRLFRFTETSSNMFLPAASDERWLELASIPLGNGGGDALDAILKGDSVGVVRLFDMPAAAARVLEAATGAGESVTEACSLVDLVAGGTWRRDPRAGESWIGVPIARAFGLDLEDADGKARVKIILNSWLNSGKFIAVSRPDRHRTMREYIENAPDKMSKSDENAGQVVLE
jgi:hypothetical protein